MRIAIISDIHGNRTAFDAVLADLRKTSPDLVLHGGDLADSGSSPVDVVDRIRELGWQGVLGNGDEMLAVPDTLEAFAREQPPQLQPLFAMVREMAAATRDMLGDDRLKWLGALPRVHLHDSFALVHASPESTWRSPTAAASDAELEAAYRSLGRSVAVYGHIHQPFVRSISGMTVANSGSVSLSYDGDPRASYLLLDDAVPAIRRVSYDLMEEVAALAKSRLPQAEWITAMLKSGRFTMP